MTRPDMAQIRQAQSDAPNLHRFVAWDTFYKRAKWLHVGGRVVAVVLALASPLVLLFWSEAGPYLGAAGGAWLFISRIALEPIKGRLQRKGATAQEMFDCAVLGIDWNDALAKRLSEEEIYAASDTEETRRDDLRARDWYPTDKPASWPTSVLICQRSNAVWARRQHFYYGWTLCGLAGTWAVIGLAVAVIDGASLATYLVTVALPSLPALLDAVELARAHSSASQRRQLVEERAEALISNGGADDQDLREMQDQLFGLRRDAPLVPKWFYEFLRPKFEAAMRYGADRLARD